MSEVNLAHTAFVEHDSGASEQRGGIGGEGGIWGVQMVVHGEGRVVLGGGWFWGDGIGGWGYWGGDPVLPLIAW